MPVVGVERTETDPSQIPYYVSGGLSTVDDLDIPPGRIALVLALAGARATSASRRPPTPRCPRRRDRRTRGSLARPIAVRPRR